MWGASECDGLKTRQVEISDFFSFLCFTDLRQLPDSTYPLQRIVESGPNGGLFPKAFNVALKAKITANATCGVSDQEYCRMADIYSSRYGISLFN